MHATCAYFLYTILCEINTTLGKYYSAYESILHLKQVSAFLSDDPMSLTHPAALQPQAV